MTHQNHLRSRWWHIMLQSLTFKNLYWFTAVHKQAETSPAPNKSTNTCGDNQFCEDFTTGAPWSKTSFSEYHRWIKPKYIRSTAKYQRRQHGLIYKIMLLYDTCSFACIQFRIPPWCSCYISSFLSVCSIDKKNSWGILTDNTNNNNNNNEIVHIHILWKRDVLWWFTYCTVNIS